MIPYEPPEYEKDSYNCPFCNAYAYQGWSAGVRYSCARMGQLSDSDLQVARCGKCYNVTIWYKEKLIYPLYSTAPFPSPDLPGEIKEDYEEARSIVSLSPRGSAALLRLAIQKLCQLLGEKGKDINDDIGNLVKKGLPTGVKEALDIVRVIGNGAVPQDNWI